MEKTITTTSKLLDLNFAWANFYLSIVLYCYLIVSKRRHILISGNLFGGISYLFGYLLNYIIKHSRILEYPEGHSSMTVGESCIFFLWFDWINGSSIVMWALLCLEETGVLGTEALRKKKVLDYMAIASVPLWFWFTPLANKLYFNHDARVVLVTCQSENYTYCVFFVLFIPLLRLERQISFKTIGKIVLAGVGCGLMHDASLHYWGMRGPPSSLLALAVSVLTEWPAVLLCISYLAHRRWESVPRPAASKREQARGRRRRGIILALACIFVAVCTPKKFWQSLDVNNLHLDRKFFKLLPLMSAQTFQQIGVGLVWTMTCSRVAPQFRTMGEDCFDSPPSLRVVATSAKGGSVLAAQLAVALGRGCGQCVGAGLRASEAWPGPDESSPDYPSDVLLATANMREWPAYAKVAGKPVRCVVVTRHPLARLRSLYLMARNGGEKWFTDSGVEKRLDLPMFESVSQFINEIGRDYLIQSHSYLQFNVAHGCLPIKYEELRVDFNRTMSTWLTHWQVKDDVQKKLLERMQAQNIEMTSGRGEGPESPNKHSEHFIAFVNSAIDGHDGGSIAALIEEQAEELHYDRKPKAPPTSPKY